MGRLAALILADQRGFIAEVPDLFTHDFQGHVYLFFVARLYDGGDLQRGLGCDLAADLFAVGRGYVSSRSPRATAMVASSR